MTTLAQYNTSLQPVRNMDIKVDILDYNMEVIDEISGAITQANLSVDADTDIRRTANINMVVHTTTMSTGIQSVDVGEIWRAGNPFWFDKYIQIFVGINDVMTGEIEWVNQGIYLINSPSINYDANNSELTFNAVDLMSKLTGMRNGYLEGITHQIKAGTEITSAIRGILEEQGFFNAIIKTPPVSEVPNDISIDIEGTAYDLLVQLRDINPNWEMFFDVDGVFYFQKIPSTFPNNTPLVDDKVWNELMISYSLDTDFEKVKNYIEVVGKTIEPDEVATPEINGNTMTISLSKPFSSYYSSQADIPITWHFGFTLGDIAQQPTERENDIYTLVIEDTANESKTYQNPQGYKVYYDNEAYFVAMTVSDEEIKFAEIAGYTQIKAIAFETNKESPFYVGDIISGDLASSTGNNVSWGDELNVLTTIAPSAFNGNIATINVSPWVDMTSSSTNTTWRFYLDLIDMSNPVSQLNITALGYTNPTLALKNADGQNVSADYKDGKYIVELKKVNTNVMSATLYYISVPATNWETPTTKIYSLPKFSRMVRGVCSGDEYDNIYTNDLAKQRAKYEIYLQARLHDSISFTNVPLYWLDVNTLVSYTLPNDENKMPILWLVKSISTDLSVTGTQSITAMRFYPLYEEEVESDYIYLTDSVGKTIIDKDGNYITVRPSE